MAKIRKDSRVRTLKSHFDNLPHFQIPFDEYRTELRDIFGMRTFRRVNQEDPNFLNKLIEAAYTDSNVNSRASEIAMMVRQAIGSLEKSLSRLRDYLLLEYSEDLRLISTKQERKDFIESIFRIFYEYLDTAQVFYEEIQILLTDLRQAGYSIKAIIEAARLSPRYEQKQGYG